MDSEGKGTGKITKSNGDEIRNGLDKLREMKKVMQSHPTEDAVTAYVGDSNTDLPCLLHADIGIIIGEAKSLRNTCERVGIRVENGASLREMTQIGKNVSAGHTLYWFFDWN